MGVKEEPDWNGDTPACGNVGMGGGWRVGGAPMEGMVLSVLVALGRVMVRVVWTYSHGGKELMVEVDMWKETHKQHSYIDNNILNIHTYICVYVNIFHTYYMHTNMHAYKILFHMRMYCAQICMYDLH